MNWWHIIVIVVAAIFCVIGVVLWITVGAVVTNPPDGSKCTSFPFQCSNILTSWGREGVVMMLATPPTHKYNYTNAHSGFLVHVGIIIMMHNSNVSLMMNFGFLSDVCDPGWHRSCDALIILGFLFSLFPVILLPTVPFIYTPLRGRVLVCCKKCEENITNKVAIIMIVVLMMCNVSSILKSSNLILYSLSTMF